MLPKPESNAWAFKIATRGLVGKQLSFQWCFNISTTLANFTDEIEITDLGSARSRTLA